VMYAPGGISSLIMMNLRLASFGKLRGLAGSYVALAGTAFVVLAGAGAMIEMVYHLQLNEALGPELKFMGVKLNAKSVDSWFGAALVLLTGLALFEVTRRSFVADWERIQSQIEKEIKRGEALA
jgi:branched-chain amino acid transport system permease protein